MSKHPTPAHLRTIPRPYDLPTLPEAYLNFPQASELFARRPDLAGYWKITLRELYAPGFDHDTPEAADERLASTLTWKVYDDLLDEATDDANGGNKPKKGSKAHQAKGNTFALARLEAYRRTAILNGFDRNRGQWLYAVQMGKVACSRLLRQHAPGISVADLEETPALESLYEAAAIYTQDLADRRMTYYRLQANLKDPATDYLRTCDGLDALL